MAQKRSKYKTDEGDYLTLEEGSNDLYRIAWFIREEGDIGGTLGETPIGHSDTRPTEKSEYEVWQADRSVKALADGCDGRGFYFESRKKGLLALKAANDALLSGDAPWPAWALQAKAAGWTPPEGWKP